MLNQKKISTFVAWVKIHDAKIVNSLIYCKIFFKKQQFSLNKLTVQDSVI